MQKKTKKIENSIKKCFEEVFGKRFRYLNIIGAGVNGVADIIICAGGFHFEIEVKAAGDIISDIQIIHLIECNRCGGFGFIITEKDVSTLRDVLLLIIAYEYDINRCDRFTYSACNYESMLSHCSVSF
jgi:hypothetical protein